MQKENKEKLCCTINKQVKEIEDAIPNKNKHGKELFKMISGFVLQVFDSNCKGKGLNK